MKRLFLALWPDSKTRKACYDVIADKDKLIGKQVIAANLHVTLVFIGQVHDACIGKIQTVCAEVKATTFSIRFDHLSFWQKPQILCLTCQQTPPQLLALVLDLQQKLDAMGFQMDTREYCPHITLFRKVKSKQNAALEPIMWNASDLCLVESLSTNNGPIYKVIQRWVFSKSIALPNKHTM